MSTRAIRYALLALVGVGALLPAASAQAQYGIGSFDVQVAANAPAIGETASLAPTGGAFHQAGGHPYSIVTHLEWNHHPDPSENAELTGKALPDGDIRDAVAELPPGVVGNPAVLPTCTAAQLNGASQNILDFVSECPTDSQVGLLRTRIGGTVTTGDTVVEPIFNMVAPSGLAARFGFMVGKVSVFLDATTGPENDYRISVGSFGTPQALRVYEADIAFWGIPADPVHDEERCNRGSGDLFRGLGTASHGPCPWKPGTPGEDDPPAGSHPKEESPHRAGTGLVPFLTLPTSCPPAGLGEEWAASTNSWEEPDVHRTSLAFSHLAPFAPDVSAPGSQQGVTGCGKVPFNPDLSAQPTLQSASSPSGLEVEVHVPTSGLLNPTGIAQSHVKKTVVTLPKGMTVNPSQADGLGVCAPEQYVQEKVDNLPGEGCPSNSKIGAVVVHTPLINEALAGNVYVAKPYDNPFGSLLALYIVLKNHDRGLLVKLPGRVSLDPTSGQITTSFDDLPQVPFESFAFKFREGPRAPLVTPPACGNYTTRSEFTPWSDLNKVVTTESSFQIDSGVAGGPCPSRGLPPFKPGLIAGSLNNAAGAYSPFYVRLFRSDEEQEMTHFSIKLPPGVIGKIAGLGYCSDAAIAAARTKTGAEELASPSCPASSYVGRTIAGAGVGSVQAYAPGKIYYAGPYHGSAISIAAITAAKVGPFDLGTVVVRQAIDVNPETGEIFIDSVGSDPIPHIINGVTSHIRDIRAYVDRPSFTLNPTSCKRTSTASTLLGSGLDFTSEIDDRPVTVSTPYQAADCAALGFKPKLSISLQGGTKRAGHPALRAVYRGRPGDANLASAQVTLPKSEFLDQSHIGTVCTRVQFNQGDKLGEKCPAKSIYGYGRATSPILDAPLTGPIFLRSSEHKLPDLVAALHAPQFDIAVVGRVDSLNGRIRTTFESVPDAPVSKFVLSMQGAKKGLLENSTNLCAKANRAIVKFDAHNGKTLDFKPEVEAECGKHKKHHAQPKAPAAPEPSPYRAR